MNSDVLAAMHLVADRALDYSTQLIGMMVLALGGVLGVFELLWLFVRRRFF